MANTYETLGENVLPSHYELLFEPNLSTFEFTGTGKIFVSIKKPTKTIQLNAGELEILSASISANGKIQGADIKMDKSKERVTISFPKPVSGKAEIQTSFKGINNDKMYGFYRSKYLDNGKEAYMLTTQFEAADARKAFPCFDEPSFKATFDLSLLVSEELQCISNMPIKKEQKQGSKKLVAFHTSPKMSSYLLYIGVGKFDVLSDNKGRIKFNIYATPGKKKYMNIAMDYMKKTVKFYESYFGIKYPLPKLDLIAVPDFSAGAMENWGAITFRESELLVDEKAPVVLKQRIAEIIAHEIAHQWFGDLVTMKWWDDLWLNESFATFMSSKANDAVFPEWNVKTQYLLDVVNTAFAADQLVSTHPINVLVNNPGEINELFDEISYEKGGSVLNMLEDYVGKEVFRKGLNIYLKSNMYSNAEKSQLWGAIDKVAKSSNKKIQAARVAKDWVEKTGYPFVKLEKKGHIVTLKQKRFTLLNAKTKNETWPIAIRYITPNKGKKQEQLLMTTGTASIKSTESVIKLNAGQAGLYRVLYPEEKLEELGEMIKSGEIGIIDAWGIENDLYAFTKACMRPVESYLKFVEEYCFTAKYPLSLSVLGHLNGLYNFFYNSKKKREAIRSLLKDYSMDVLKQVGWIRSKDESNITTMTRSSAIVASGIAGDKATLNKANKMFSDFISGKREIESNLKGAIYTLAAWSGNSKTFEIFSSRYKKEQLPEEKQRLLRSLAMFSDKKIIAKALKFSLSKDVRYQDAFIIPALTVSKPAGRDMVWPWMKKNWPLLKSRYGSGGGHMLGRYYIGSLGACSGDKILKDIGRFFANPKNKADSIEMSVKQTKEDIQINTRFLKHNGVR